MPPVLIDVRNARDADELRDVVFRAVQAVAEGKLVAFPTETVYGVATSALDESAVTRLAEAKGRGPNHPMTLAIRGPEEARDYAPDMSLLARRLARRCWPGPVTLVVDDSHPESLVRQLPPGVQRMVAPADKVGLRVPGHQLVLDVLHMLAGPLVLSSANLTGQPDALTAKQVLDALGGEIDMILDDGPCRFGQPSSVVKISGNQLEVLRAGVVPEKTLRRLSSMMLLFVCTGNTCRSPMAEAIAKHLLSQRLKCGIDEIEDRGVIVASAGVAAMMGGHAAPEAVRAVAEMGLNLGDHETQPLTEPLVRHADVIYVMSRAHRESILAQWPAAADRTQLLCADGSEICDPIGGPLERYQRCALQIQSELASRVDELEI
jgi:protein-tyrosine phosphatase